MSWLLNLLSGLIAVLISAALLHFGGSSTDAPNDHAPAARPDNAATPGAAPAEDEAPRHG